MNRKIFIFEEGKTTKVYSLEEWDIANGLRDSDLSGDNRLIDYSDEYKEDKD